MRKWVVFFSVLVPLGIGRASVVTYMDTAKLVRLSPVIVRGVVESVEAVEGDGDQIYTEITLGIVEDYRGMGDLRRLRLHQLGGRLADRESRVFGTATFTVGEEVIVFARPTKSGWLTVTGLFQGKLDVEYVGGTAYARRSAPADPVAVVGSTQDDPGPEPLTTWRVNLERLMAIHPPVEIWAPPIDEGLGEPDSSIPIGPNFTLVPIPTRRFEPDWGLPIDYYFNPLNAPAAPGGARNAFVDALAAWTGVTGSNAELRDGGDTSAQCYLTFDGVSGISHGDPCGEMPAFDSTTCSGVLAIGGLSEINPFSTKVVHGQSYIQGLQGDVVLNAGADCFWSKPGNYEEVLTHEIGHTLGLGHSCGDDDSPSCSSDPLLDEAQMRAFAHGDGRGADLRRDDVLGLRFIYPPEAFIELYQSASSAVTGDNVVVTLDINGTTVADVYVFLILPSGEVTGGLGIPSLPLAFYPDISLIDYTFNGSETTGDYWVIAGLVPPGMAPTADNALSYSYVKISFAAGP